MIHWKNFNLRLVLQTTATRGKHMPTSRRLLTSERSPQIRAE